MSHPSFRNAGLAGLSALTMALVACGGSSKSSAPPVTVAKNLPPVIQSVSGPAYLVSEHTYILTISATDPEGDALTYSTASAADGTVTGNQVTYKAPTVAADSVKTVSVSVTDGKSTASYVASFQVKPNRAPVFVNALPGVVSLTKGTSSPLSTTVAATDPDGDTVTLAKDGTWPAWASFDVASGTFTIDPAAVPTADLDVAKTLKVTASDAYGATSTCVATVTVAAAKIIFNVTNVTQPAVVVAGRWYPNGADDELVKNHMFTAYCDYPISATDELSWSFIYNGTEVLKQKTTGKSVVVFNPIHIPLADFGATRYYSVQVTDTKGNIGKSNTYAVTPVAPVYPWMTEVDLNDVRGLRENDDDSWYGLMPVWNAPKVIDPAQSVDLWGKQYIDLTLYASDTGSMYGSAAAAGKPIILGEDERGGMLPFVWSNAKAYAYSMPKSEAVGAAATALKGTITVTTDPADSTKAVLKYTPAKEDIGITPYFEVDLTNSAGLTTTVTIHGLDGSFDSVYPYLYNTPGEDAYQHQHLASNGTNLVPVRDNHAPTINAATFPNGPQMVAGEEGSTPYKVEVGTNLLVVDQDFPPEAGGPTTSLDFFSVLLLGGAQLPEVFTGPSTKTYAAGYLNTPVYTDINDEGIDTSENEIKFLRDGRDYSITWNPSHANVRKELGISAKATDLYDATSAKGLSWVAQVSSVVCGFKLDTVAGGTLSGRAFDDTVVDGTARKLHFYPVHSKGTVGVQGTYPDLIYPYGVNMGYEAEADIANTQSEFGILATATQGIYVTPTTNPEAGLGVYETRGINADNASGLTPQASAGVIPHGYYLVKVDDLRAGVRPVDMNSRYFFTNVTGGLKSGDPAPYPDTFDLSKTYIGRDAASATTAPAVLGASSYLRNAAINELTEWDTKRSALQFSNVKLSKGNVFLGVSEGSTSSNVLSSGAIKLPFPTLYSTQNVAPSVAGSFLLKDGLTGVSNGTLLTNFEGLAPNVANETVLISQLSPKDITVGGTTVQAMALTKTVEPTPKPMAVMTTGGLVEYNNFNVTATKAPETTWYTNVKRSAFTDLIPATGGVVAGVRKASYNNEFFGVFQAHNGFAEGFEQNAALLFTFQNLGAGGPAALDMGPVSFGNPFTAGSKVAEYFVQSAVSVSDGYHNPGTAPALGDYGTLAKVGVVTGAQAEAGDKGYAPGIAPVSDVTFSYAIDDPDDAGHAVLMQTVDIANVPSGLIDLSDVVAYGQNTGATTPAFTLSWTAPANYSGADVEVWGYSGTGSASKLTTITTGGTSVKFPTTLVPGGSSYFFRIRAFYMAGVKFNVTPLKRVLPMSYADFVTQAVPMS